MWRRATAQRMIPASPLARTVPVASGITFAATSRFRLGLRVGTSAMPMASAARCSSTGSMPVPGSGSGIRPSCALSITSFQISAGREPPVIPRMGLALSLPIHTPPTQFAV